MLRCMDRLNTDDIHSIPDTIKEYDADLKAKIGKSLIELARYLADDQEIDRVIMKSKAAIVPITAGLGIIEGFAEAIAAILRHIGMDAFVTQNTDIAGFFEAFSNNVDLIFTGDDLVFSAFNINRKKVVDNSFATGRAYAATLELAAGGVKGKTAVVVGAGRVGLSAIDYLIKKGAKVIVIEIDKDKVTELKKRYKSLIFIDSIAKAIKYTRLILIAAPVSGLLNEHIVDSETIVSSPAIPLGLTEPALKKLPANNLIHDPLQLGVLAMVALAFT
ncbi:MAG: 3-methylornithyl-N6-L-lysine dehydrogenase PylD [Candidatus Methylarchaceae archaeon HK02M1]|nr:3-methylornithyl-N6-L-lysine dehydrogenase PylD [Candidatus Methylarchaceae archaeon HK02M1]